jgi:teichuronic acid biosynthesis glycosyltransferase TuaC
MRILTFTSLYPNPAQPRHGIFVEHRIRQIAASGEAAVQVIAPVPWVPVSSRIAGRFAVLANVPRANERHGTHIVHPRFLAIPKITSWLNPVSMAAAALPTIMRLRRQRGDFDLIDAHFLYPDGAAAILLGIWLRKPVVVTARGTDVNEFPRYLVPRAWIRWVTRRAAALITVSGALRTALLGLGVPPERVTVLRNGVDLQLFAPRGRSDLRRQLRLERSTLLSVGHLVEGKGHDIVLEALPGLPDAELIVIGEGPQSTSLRASAARLGVSDRVRWIGNISQRELAEFYEAADVTVLPSKREGMPNVLLESLACGTPVIATAVGGIAEIVNAPEAGILMHDRTPQALCQAYVQLMANLPNRESVRRHAEQFEWGPITSGLLEIFRSVISSNDSRCKRDGMRASVRATVDRRQ